MSETREVKIENLMEDRNSYVLEHDPEVQKDLLDFCNDTMSIEPMNDRERALEEIRAAEASYDQILDDERLAIETRKSSEEDEDEYTNQDNQTPE